MQPKVGGAANRSTFIVPGRVPASTGANKEEIPTIIVTPPSHSLFHTPVAPAAPTTTTGTPPIPTKALPIGGAVASTVGRVLETATEELLAIEYLPHMVTKESVADLVEIDPLLFKSGRLYGKNLDCGRLNEYIVNVANRLMQLVDKDSWPKVVRIVIILHYLLYSEKYCNHGNSPPPFNISTKLLIRYLTTFSKTAGEGSEKFTQILPHILIICYFKDDFKTSIKTLVDKMNLAEKTRIINSSGEIMLFLIINKGHCDILNNPLWFMSDTRTIFFPEAVELLWSIGHFIVTRDNSKAAHLKLDGWDIEKCKFCGFYAYDLNPHNVYNPSLPPLPLIISGTNARLTDVTFPCSTLKFYQSLLINITVIPDDPSNTEFKKCVMYLSQFIKFYDNRCVLIGNIITMDYDNLLELSTISATVLAGNTFESNVLKVLLELGFMNYERCDIFIQEGTNFKSFSQVSRFAPRLATFAGASMPDKIFNELRSLGVTEFTGATICVNNSTNLNFEGCETDGIKLLTLSTGELFNNTVAIRIHPKDFLSNSRSRTTSKPSRVHLDSKIFGGFLKQGLTSFHDITITGTLGIPNTLNRKITFTNATLEINTFTTLYKLGNDITFAGETTVKIYINFDADDSNIQLIKNDIQQLKSIPKTAKLDLELSGTDHNRALISFIYAHIGYDGLSMISLITHNEHLTNEQKILLIQPLIDHLVKYLLPSIIGAQLYLLIINSLRDILFNTQFYLENETIQKFVYGALLDAKEKDAAKAIVRFHQLELAFIIKHLLNSETNLEKIMLNENSFFNQVLYRGLTANDTNIVGLAIQLREKYFALPFVTGIIATAQQHEVDFVDYPPSPKNAKQLFNQKITGKLIKIQCAIVFMRTKLVKSCKDIGDYCTQVITLCDHLTQLIFRSALVVTNPEGGWQQDFALNFSAMLDELPKKHRQEFVTTRDLAQPSPDFEIFLEDTITHMRDLLVLDGTRAKDTIGTAVEHIRSEHTSWHRLAMDNNNPEQALAQLLQQEANLKVQLEKNTANYAETLPGWIAQYRFENSQLIFLPANTDTLVVAIVVPAIYVLLKLYHIEQDMLASSIQSNVDWESFLVCTKELADSKELPPLVTTAKEFLQANKWSMGTLFQLFPLFNTYYQFERNNIKILNTLDLFDLEEYKDHFIQALMNEEYHGLKLIPTATNQLSALDIENNLRDIFGIKTNFSSLGDDINGNSLRLEPKHLSDIFEIFGSQSLTNSNTDLSTQARQTEEVKIVAAKLTPQDKTELLIVLAIIFTKYTSASFFGNGNTSPLMLRYYACTLLNEADELTRTLNIPHNITPKNHQDWIDRLSGTGVGVETCTGNVALDMMEKAKNFKTFKTYFPVPWRLAPI